MTGLRLSKLVGLSAALVLWTALSASATTLAVDGDWLMLEDCMSEGQFFTGAGSVFPSYPSPGVCTSPNRGTGSGNGTSDIALAQHYEWTSAGNVQLDVTDWSVATDRFKIWIDTFDLLNPYATLAGGVEWQDIPGCDLTDGTNGFGVGCHQNGLPGLSFVDPNFAHGSYVLGPGTHSLVIQSIEKPRLLALNDTLKIPTSTAAIRLLDLTRKIDEPDPVPEPASLLLLGSGLIGGALRVRRLRKRGPGA